jgi:1-deoxy-D-xylulose-5-phosphate reductoisomerase
MSRLIAETMQKVSFVQSPTLDDYLETDTEARAILSDLVR